MSWTDDKIDKLQRLWGKGLTASQIAKEIGGGITRNAVIGKAHRLKLPSRPSPVKSDAKKATAAPAAAPASAPARPAPEKVAPKATEDQPEHRTALLELTEQTCKWPIGHPGDADFYFCGKPSRPGVPYCPDHCLMAFQAQLPRKDRPAGR